MFHYVLTMTSIIIGEWLSHPLLLLTVGALTTGYLIPYFARRWQDHQKELDLKISIIDKIDDSVTRILLASIYGKDIENKYFEWEISRAKIRSYLQAYFPKETIESRWVKYYNLIRDFFTVTGLRGKVSEEENIKRHNESIQNMKNYLSNTDFNNNWEGWKRLNGDDVAKLAEVIQREKEHLIQEIVNLRISLFSSVFDRLRL